jgi:hypothetical protein
MSLFILSLSMVKSRQPAADECAVALGLGCNGVMLRASTWREYSHREAARKSVGSTAAAQRANGATNAEMFESTPQSPR